MYDDYPPNILRVTEYEDTLKGPLLRKATTCPPPTVLSFTAKSKGKQNANL